jgi:hypothetical protein
MGIGPSGLPTVTIVPRYLEHKGGTKFYEVMGFEFEGVRLVVKRWGANEFFKRLDQGPEIVVEKIDGLPLTGSVDQVVAQKTKASKGYSRVTVAHGFHKAMSDSAYDLEVDSFISMLSNHYGSTRAARIKSYWPDLEDIDLSGAIHTLNTPVGAVNDKPKIEIDRGEQWGAW